MHAASLLQLVSLPSMAFSPLHHSIYHRLFDLKFQPRFFFFFSSWKPPQNQPTLWLGALSLCPHINSFLYCLKITSSHIGLPTDYMLLRTGTCSSWTGSSLLSFHWDKIVWLVIIHVLVNFMCLHLWKETISLIYLMVCIHLDSLSQTDIHFHNFYHYFPFSKR